MSSGQSQQQRAPHKPTLSVQIRWMIRRDMAEVLDIERDSFEFNWTEEDFLSCLRQRNCIGMVAEHEGRVCGFMIYFLSDIVYALGMAEKIPMILSVWLIPLVTTMLSIAYLLHIEHRS